jgi:hypothetical protein
VVINGGASIFFIHISFWGVHYSWSLGFVLCLLIVYYETSINSLLSNSSFEGLFFNNLSNVERLEHLSFTIRDLKDGTWSFI